MNGSNITKEELDVRNYIDGVAEARIKHYESQVLTGDKKDTQEEQAWTKDMQRLIADMWKEVITRGVNASINQKLPANYMMNAVLHASVESAVMSIQSYVKAAANAAGLLGAGVPKTDTKQLVDSFGDSFKRSLNEVAKANNLI